MMKIFFLIFSIFFQIYSIQAQKFELGNVTKEELLQKVHPIENDASASNIFKCGESSFYYDLQGKWFYTTTINYKIKIYNKEGLKYANQKIEYFAGDVGEKVIISKAYSYNLVDDKIEKTKLKSEGEFDEKLNENWNVKKLTFPNVKEGTIIEYSVKLISPYITNFNDFYFQSEIPTDFVSYKVYIPSYFRYRTIITGYETIKSEEKTLETSKLGETKYTYFKDNVPSIKEEDFVDNIKNYTSIIKFELASVEYPNSLLKNVALDWEGVAKSIYEDERFGSELKKTNYFEKDLPIITNGMIHAEEKINTILNFVKNKVRWNGKYGYLCIDGVKKAYEKGIGNVAEINLMLVAMLRDSHIEANPVLVSTKSNGIAIFPTRAAYNYVIAAVEIDDNVVLLDATENYSSPDVLPVRVMNWVGRLIRKNGTSNEIDLKAKETSKEVISIDCKINDTGSIQGQVRKQVSAHNALIHRNKYNSLSLDDYLEKLEVINNDIKVSNYKVENQKETSKNLIEVFSFRDDNSFEKMGDKIYVSPLLFLKQDENLFKEEKRKFPIDFAFPKIQRYILNIEIPEGYIVESLPKEINLTAIENYALFKYFISNKENKVQLQVTTEIRIPMVVPNDYEELKAFYNEIVKKHSEKIILKKV